jgi:hypothetical protein
VHFNTDAPKYHCVSLSVSRYLVDSAEASSSLDRRAGSENFDTHQCINPSSLELHDYLKPNLQALAPAELLEGDDSDFAIQARDRALL